MRAQTAAISLALLLGIAGNPIDRCDATTITVVLAESLNVRDAPNGKIIWTLTQGQGISVSDVVGDWARIFYWVDGGGRDGWVPKQHIGTQRSAWYQKQKDCKPVQHPGAEVCVEITDSRISCGDDLDGEYYGLCTITVWYTVATDYTGDAVVNVVIGFDIELEFDRANMGFWRSDSKSARELLRLTKSNYRNASVEIVFNCGDYGRVTDAIVGVLSCDINEVSVK